MRALVVAAVLGLALSSCGEDEPSAATTTSSTTSAPSSTSTSASAATAECGTVGFTPNSEDAASDIRATGLDCEEARAFVEVAGRRTSSGGPPEVEVEGYRCVMTGSREDPLPQADYECTNGPKRVTFVRS